MLRLRKGHYSHEDKVGIAAVMKGQVYVELEGKEYF